MALQIEQFMCRSDNFGVLVHDAATGETALIDAPEEAAILAAIERTGWTPTVILTTHHHADHVEANLALKERFGLKIVGPEAEKDKIPGIDVTVKEGSPLTFAGQPVRVIETPGHTAGHVCYYLPQSNLIFTADTLFALGCGRLLEGDAATMQRSLAKLRALPDETRVYCGHEYTLANARFALTVDPDNPALRARAAAVAGMRERGEATVPSTLGEEKATNPFLRWDDPAIRRGLGMAGAGDADVLGEIRARKDRF